MIYNFSAIILSAGFSSRMGGFKPLLQLGDKTLIENAVHLFLSAGVRDIIAVTGFGEEKLKDVLQRLKISYIKNPLYEEGMFTSVKAGISALGSCDAFFILPVDIPLVNKGTIEALKRAFSGERNILYPVFRGKRGHPPLISANYTNDILQYNGDNGLSGFLKQHDNIAREIRVTDKGILLDCDEPEDYNYIVKRFESGVPEQEEIDELYRIYGLDDNIISHCRAVARKACRAGLRGWSLQREFEADLAPRGRWSHPGRS